MYVLHCEGVRVLLLAFVLPHVRSYVAKGSGTPSTALLRRIHTLDTSNINFVCSSLDFNNLPSILNVLNYP